MQRSTGYSRLSGEADGNHGDSGEEEDSGDDEIALSGEHVESIATFSDTNGCRLRQTSKKAAVSNGDHDDFLAGQYSKPSHLPAAEIPWKPIGLAFALFVVGGILLAAGCLIHTGHVDQGVYGDRLWPLIFLGLLMFIPGAYHVHIAVNAFLGKPGYSYDDIPALE